MPIGTSPADRAAAPAGQQGRRSARPARLPVLPAPVAPEPVVPVPVPRAPVWGEPVVPVPQPEPAWEEPVRQVVVSSAPAQRHAWGAVALLISASAWLSEAVSGAPEQNPEFSAATAQPAPVQAASAALEQKAAAAQGSQGALAQAVSAPREQTALAQAASAAPEQKPAAVQGPQGAPVQVTSAAPEPKPGAAPVDWGAPVDHLRRRRS
jgi:hypothetical protein